MKKILLLVACGIVMVGCSTVPRIRVARPWRRSIEGSNPITLGAKFSVDVRSISSPLLGTEQIVNEQIKNTLEHLLHRRGFNLAPSTAEYNVQLRYKTERHEQFRHSSVVGAAGITSYVSGGGTGVYSSYGRGVGIASVISAATIKSETSSSQMTEQVSYYQHTVSVDIQTSNRNPVWRGDLLWDTSTPNITPDIARHLQYLLSELPSDYSYRPEASEIKDTHVKNYYSLNCVGHRFSCPALPWSIRFPASLTDTIETALPREIKDPQAMAAYVDLIKNAEYALPIQSRTLYKDPTNVDIWRKATIGGRYLLGTKKRPINVIVKMRGLSDGYVVEDCRMVSDEEFDKFNRQLVAWKKVLDDYFDVYAR